LFNKLAGLPAPLELNKDLNKYLEQGPE